jgi:P2 family phage contractile tail tube protein
MPQLTVNRLTNANVYINGASFLGKAEEIDLPKIVAKMVEHKALGMAGGIELPSGFDKMEARIKWNSFYGDTMAIMANPYQVHALQCRASLENYTAAGKTGEVPVVCYMRGQFKEVPLGNFKQHDNVELDSRLAVTYVKLEINGVPVIEFDALANIYKVNGVDILAKYRNNIGG